MKTLHSTLVAFDGESKCGKTTVIDGVKEEALYQASVFEKAKDIPYSEAISRTMAAYVDPKQFANITAISAGNSFRTATYYLQTEEQAGRHKKSFDESDIPRIRSMLNTDGIHDILQNDPNIEDRVSTVAKMTGVISVCETIFCDAVQDAYNAADGSNLVIVDARNPVDVMQRRSIVGTDKGQIMPYSILPIFIDTPLEIAASRTKGSFEENLTKIRGRRHNDLTRQEHPFVRPANLEHDFWSWIRQSRELERDEIAPPLYFDNGGTTTLGEVQYFSGMIATHAQDTAISLHFRELGIPIDIYPVR